MSICRIKQDEPSTRKRTQGAPSVYSNFQGHLHSASPGDFKIRTTYTQKSSTNDSKISKMLGASKRT